MNHLSGHSPAFCAGNIARPALQSIALLLAAVFSAITMVKQAHAAGAIAATATYTIYHTSNHEHCDNLQAAYYTYSTPADTLASFKASFPRYCHQGGILKWTQVTSNFVLTSDTSLTFTADVAPTAYTGGSHNTGIVKTWTASWTCPSDYTGPDASHMCILACPLHATGTPCACDAGYVFDAAGTSCILEQYTISLQIPPPAEVAAGATKSAYAEVTKSDGSAKSGVNVDLFLDVVPELAGQLPVTYTGTLTPDSGFTDVDGRLSFEFKAPVAGGVHTITAMCTNCTNSPVTGTITVPGCSVDPLKELPADDLCALSLEAGQGVDVNGKCPPLDARLPDQMRCFADKIVATNLTAMPKIPYSGPSATIRNAAYQAHLQNVWDKMIELDDLSDPAIIMACKPLRDKVIAEIGCNGGHCLDYRPADNSNHSKGTAFDVPRKTINGLLGELTPLPPALIRPQQRLQRQRMSIAYWLAKPTACNLYWGGNFTNPGPDYVHFQLP